jgi:hypothetical protein
MAKVMLTVQLAPDQATPEDARSKLGLGDDDLDVGFGVVPIDPDRDLYAVLVEDHVAARASSDGLAGGPFANPKIEPFGAPVSAKEPGGSDAPIETSATESDRLRRRRPSSRQRDDRG